MRLWSHCWLAFELAQDSEHVVLTLVGWVVLVTEIYENCVVF